MVALGVLRNQNAPEQTEETRLNRISFIFAEIPKRLSFIFAGIENGHESFLRDVDVADRLHPLLSFFLLGP